MDGEGVSVGDVLAKIYDQGRMASPVIKLDDGRQVIVTPNDARANVYEAHNAPLLRIEQKVELHDADSFCAYVNRFKTDASAIFAEPGFLARDSRAKLHCVFDYHAPGDPAHKAHAAIYVPRYSDQWTRWHLACTKAMAQSEFAEFIEEVRNDIVHPDAAQLMDIVRTFKANKKVDYDSLVYQANGSVKLNYSEKVEQSGESGALPEVMNIGIPVYFRGERYAIPVFVRYRVGGGGVQFHLKIDRPDVFEDEAFNGLADATGTETALPVYLGRI